VLEFAVGTGRIALPLVKAGLRADGIELSQDMVDRMREKPDGDTVTVTMGDMARVTTGRTYGLVYLVYNTIGNLLTQDDQVRCFQNAAHHLTDDGVFVLECRVPTAPSRPDHQYVDAEHIGVDHVVLDVYRYDPVTQILDENHVRIGAEGLVVFSPIRLRLAYPPEFDLMARIAGLGCVSGGEAGTASRTPPPIGAMSASTSDRTTGDNRPSKGTRASRLVLSAGAPRPGGHERHQPGRWRAGFGARCGWRMCHSAGAGTSRQRPSPRSAGSMLGQRTV
jgi:Methyltransferase domain